MTIFGLRQLGALYERHKTRYDAIRKDAAIVAGLLVFVAVPLFWLLARQAETCARQAAALTQARQLIDRMPEIERENARLNRLTGMAEATAPEAHPYSSLLTALLAAAKKSRISFIAIRPMAAGERGGYRQVPLKIEVKAGYHQIGRFFSELKNSDCPIAIHSFTLRADKTGEPEIEAVIDASTYYLK
ncbi:MAG: type 4a pilus biogenesis protein PilO [Candidatus Edwardsbacteria bacterium]|nr:type 4a pilus biogenesis protein PilO [Candidatus Edwardsbacteria bacterium]